MGAKLGASDLQHPSVTVLPSTDSLPSTPPLLPPASPPVSSSLPSVPSSPHPSTRSGRGAVFPRGRGRGRGRGKGRGGGGASTAKGGETNQPGMKKKKPHFNAWVGVADEDGNEPYSIASLLRYPPQREQGGYLFPLSPPQSIPLDYPISSDIAPSFSSIKPLSKQEWLDALHRAYLDSYPPSSSSSHPPPSTTSSSLTFQVPRQFFLDYDTKKVPVV